MEQIRILHVLNTGSFSGAENVVITICDNLSDKYECVYVALNGDINKILEKHNISYCQIEKLSVMNLRKIIKKYNPDIIHAHDFTASLIASLSTFKTPIVFHLHNNPEWIKKVNLKNVLFLISTFRASKILTVSDSVISENIFQTLWRYKALIIGNPLDIKEMISKEGSIRKMYDLIFLGRLTAQKNPKRFIKIIEQLNKEKKDIKAIMVGDGELNKVCRELIEYKHLNHNISMLGFRNDRLDLIKQSKIMVITSSWEGFGLMCVESLANGIPVVSTGVGGLKNLLDSDGGFIANTDEDFVNEIIRLLDDNEYYNKRLELSLKRASELHNIDSYIHNLEKLYLEVYRHRE